MTWTRRYDLESGQIKTSSHNFKAPNIEDAGTVEVLFPTTDIQTATSATTISVAVKQATTVVKADLAHAATLNLVVDADVTKGSEVIVVAKSDATARDITLGTGFVGGTIAGTISKTKAARFIHNGTAFMLVGLSQLD